MPPTPEQLEQLVALAAGELDEPSAAALRATIEQDPEWRSAYSELTRMVRFLQAERDTEPSAGAVRRAVGLLRAERPGLIERLESGLRRFVASLDFDSRLSPAVAGIRGAGTTVMLSFSSEAADLDLELTEGRGTEWVLRGQIESDEEGEWEVAVSERDGASVGGSVVRTTGAFELRLMEGVYTIRLTRGDAVVEAGPFTVP